MVYGSEPVFSRNVSTNTRKPVHCKEQDHEETTIRASGRVVFALSGTRQILQFTEALDFGGILTLAPLRNSPEDGRFLVTVALCVLVFVTVMSFLRNRR